MSDEIRLDDLPPGLVKRLPKIDPTHLPKDYRAIDKAEIDYGSELGHKRGLYYVLGFCSAPEGLWVAQEAQLKVERVKGKLRVHFEATVTSFGDSFISMGDISYYFSLRRKFSVRRTNHR